jgi:predicted component of type VI protein secretion system
MAGALNAIVQVPVTCTLIHGWQQVTRERTNVLGTIHLGDDSTCGTNFEDEDYVFDFSIHLTEAKDISEYLEGGNLYHLLQAFYQYFVPANAGFQTTLVFQNKQKEWWLGQENPHHLGISSFI